MNSQKEAIIDLAANLPDDATYDEMMYRLYVLTKIERGLKDMTEGNVISAEEAKIRTSRWRTQ